MNRQEYTLGTIEEAARVQLPYPEHYPDPVIRIKVFKPLDLDIAKEGHQAAITLGEWVCEFRKVTVSSEGVLIKPFWEFRGIVEGGF